MSPEEWHPMAALRPTQADVQHLQCAPQPLTSTHIPGSNHLHGLTGSHTACWVVPMGIVEFRYWNGLRKREKINMFPHRTVHKSQTSLSVPTATSDSVHLLCTEVWVCQGASPYTHAHCKGWIKEQRAGFSKDGENIPTQLRWLERGPRVCLELLLFWILRKFLRPFGCTEN